MRRLPVLPGLLLLVACGGGGTGPATPPPAPPPPPAPVPVATVTLAPDHATLVPAQTVSLVATVKDVAGNVLSGRAITWTSSSASATVDGNGVVTAVGQGAASVVATSEGQTASAAITINDGGFVGAAGGSATGASGNVTVSVPPGAVTAGLAISIAPIASPPADPNLAGGTAYDFGPSGTQFAQPVTLKIKYDPALLPAGADPALLRLHRLTGASWTPLPGSTVDVATRTVTGQTSSFSTYAVLQVPIPVATVTVAPGAVALQANQTRQLTATTLDASGSVLSGRVIAWSSSATAVAAVSATGLVTAIAGGAATITATSEGRTGTAAITVTDGGTVGLSGGTITAAAGAVTLVFPTNAVANGTVVTVSAVTAPPAPFAGQVLTVVPGAAYSFGPNGQAFAKGVPLTIKYQVSNLPPGAIESDLAIYTFSNGAWTPVSASTVDLVNKTVTAPVNHFSIWGILAPVSAAPGYTLTDLGVLPGKPQSSANGVNNNGDVVGNSDGPGLHTPFLYHNGVMSRLLGLDIANAINDNGQIAGFSFALGAVRYANGGGITSFAGAGAVGAGGINASGVMAGGANPPPGSPGLGSQPALLGGGVTLLATLPGDHYGLAVVINDAGEAAGVSSTPGQQRAVRFSGGTAVDLGAGPFSYATGINNSGQIVGYSNVSGAYLYSGGVTTVLPVVPGTSSSIARGINDAGLVVGEYSVGTWGRAFQYGNGALVDINTFIGPSQFVMTQAFGINNKGQIVGVGVTSKADLLAGRPTIQHAFLLSPN